MKNDNFTHRLMLGLMICVIVFFTGCNQRPVVPTVTTPMDTTGTAQPQPVETDPTATAESTVDTSSAESTVDASLSDLRQVMADTSQLFAVAYLGYLDQPAAPFDHMLEHAYWLCEDLPFLLEIPADRIIGETGELFCIVPLDEDATVAVSKGYWDEENEQYIYDDMLYSSSAGDPILLFCNAAGWEPDTQVYICGVSGEVFWCPQTDDNLCAAPLPNDIGEALFHDFSPYRELLMKRHRDMKDSNWLMPTAEMLEGTAWYWDGILKDGRAVNYQLVFDENVLSVRWNDGIDEQDHECLYAPWELTYDEGFAILSIDFGTFEGIQRYNLLYHEEYGQLYVAMDAVQQDLNLGLEPLYRFLTQPAAPEPTEMIGTWELAWTETDGDRSEAEQGNCIIEVSSAASAGLLMSYSSREFPENDFRDELLTFDDRQMHIFCGNNDWVADLNYVGPYDTTYAVTLTVDDILIKQNYFLLDGAPTVSYEFFRRVA